jgi:hypothetical protein
MIDNKIMRYFIQKPLFFVALLCLSLAACESIDDQSSINNRPTYLPIQDQVAAHPLGDDLYIAYTSDSKWEIQIDGGGSWVSASPSDSQQPGTQNIIFTVDPNLSSGDEFRTCTVKFVSGSIVLNKFTITQSRAVIDIESKFRDIEMGWQQLSDQQLSIESNIQWTIKCDNREDFSFDFEQNEKKGVKTPGSDFRYEVKPETITYATLKNNLDPSDKEVKLTITPYKEDVYGNVKVLDQDVVAYLTREIKISQDYLIFMVNDSREEVDLGSFSELGTTYRDFTLTSELDWNAIGSNIGELEDHGAALELVDEQPDEIEGRAVKVYNLRLSMTKPNPSLERADHTLRFFTVADEDAYRETRFSQDPYIFDFIELDQSIDSLKAVNAGDTLAFRIETTGPWKIDETTVPEWMSFDLMEGEGTTEIQAFVPDKNMSFENLDRAVRFTTNSFNDAVEKNLIAHQDRFRFDLKDIDQDMGKPWSRMNVSVHEFTLVSDGAWTMYLDDDSAEVVEWLDIVATDGSEAIAMGEDHRISGAAGTWTFSVNADSFNNETYDRTKAIRLTSDLHKEADNEFWPDRAIHRYDITQQKYVFEIMHGNTDISKSNTTIGGEAASAYNPDSYKIAMNCGAPWRIIDKPSWVSFDTEYSSGDNYEDITMTVANNVGSDWSKTRGGYITVRSYKEYAGLPSEDENAPGEDKRFRIDQDRFIFEVPQDGVSNSCEALNEDSFPITINTIAGAGWSITPSSTWIHNRTITGNGSVEQSIKPGYNGTLSDRNGTVTIKSTALGTYSPTYKVTFNQKAYEFKVTSETAYNFETLKGDGQAKTVTIKCTGDWSITGAPTWITLSQNSGRGNKDITVSVNSTNTSLIASTRQNVTVTVKSTVAETTHSHTFTVSQKPYEFSVDPTKVTSKDAVSKFEGDIAVTSTGGFSAAEITVSQQKDLLTITRNTSGVTYEMAENYSLSEVTNKFSITSNDHSSGDDLYKEVTLTRAAYIFKSSLEDGSVITCGAAKDLERTFSQAFESTGGFQDMGIAYDGTEKDWLKDSKFDVSKGTLTIKAAENKGKNPRSAKITIKSNDYEKNSAELSFTYIIGQDGTETTYKK